MIENNKYKVLVVEDEQNISSFVRSMLESNNYQVFIAYNCEQGEMMFSSYVPDVVILDLGLPDKDGMEFIRYARQKSSIPILVLSARVNESDKVEALDAGANDYITKPFGSAELLARVRAALRNRMRGQDSNVAPKDKFILKDLIIDYEKRYVMKGTTEIKFTQTEYNIVVLLSLHVGKVLTYATIIKEIWGSVDSGSTKKLQVNMANIRKKLGVKPGEYQYISNELGVGYKMQE